MSGIQGDVPRQWKQLRLDLLNTRKQQAQLLASHGAISVPIGGDPFGGPRLSMFCIACDVAREFRLIFSRERGDCRTLILGQVRKKMAILKRHVLQYARPDIPARRLHSFRIGQRGVDQARQTFGARFELSMTSVHFFFFSISASDDL